MVIFVASDNLIWILGLIDEVSGAYVDDASVTAQVLTPDGMTVVAMVNLEYVVGPKTVNGQTFQDGCYCGQLPAATGLVVGTNYQLRVVSSAGGATLTKLVQTPAVYDGVD